MYDQSVNCWYHFGDGSAPRLEHVSKCYRFGAVQKCEEALFVVSRPDSTGAKCVDRVDLQKMLQKWLLVFGCKKSASIQSKMRNKTFFKEPNYLFFFLKRTEKNAWLT